MSKLFSFCSYALALLLLSACGNSTETQQKQSPLPRPGTVIASSEMPITNDQLNHFTFSIKIIADSNISAGVYDVETDFGPNFASGTFTMPKGGEHFTPVLKKGIAPYTYIIGFKIPNDTTFYDYFEVSSSKTTTRMQYIKAYTF